MSAEATAPEGGDPCHDLPTEGSDPCYDLPSPDTLAQYDYVRFTWTDMHGIPRSKLVPRRNTTHMWEEGGHVFAGSPIFGPRSEVLPFPEIEAINYGNITIRPVTETLHKLPWAGGEGVTIGQVLCDSYWIQTGRHHDGDTRHIAHRMLDRLHAEFQLRCLSAFELEFFLLHKDSQKPVFEGFDIYAAPILAQNEDFLCKMDRELHGSGVNLEHILSEYESGQFEAPTVPMYGMKALDNAFLMKEGIKEISDKSGLEAVFMTKPFYDLACNGTHYNHSLWREDGENAFYDAESEDRMSATFRHWVGGVHKHIKALLALCCPTVNCYRRLYKPWAPDLQNWGIENRMASFRAKNYDKKNTYFENRLPSGSSNPYLVVAATLAAGMDGLRNKIEPPPQNDPSAPKLASNLEDALNDLEKDEVVREALGETFVRWWLREKREVEVAKVNARDYDSDKFAVEKYLYKYL